MKTNNGKILEITNLYTGEEFRSFYDNRSAARREGRRAIARMEEGVYTITDFATGTVLDYEDSTCLEMKLRG